jgi:hypothetical protein
LIHPKLTKLFPKVLAWAVVFSIGSFAVLAQDSSTAAVPAPGKTDSTDLPDVPQPASGPALKPPPVSQESSSQPLAFAGQAPQGPVTVKEETLLRVLTTESINSKQTKDGASLTFTLCEDVLVGDELAIPRGATVRGVVLKSKKAGMLTGSPELTLKLTSLELGGRDYPLFTYRFAVKGTSKTRPTEVKAIRGAYSGAIVGSFVSGISSKGVVSANDTNRAVSMTAGAALGAGVGTAVSAATPGPGIWIPSEAQVDFFLAAPVTVVPVSAREAARLGQGLPSGGPVLYLRGETP